MVEEEVEETSKVEENEMSKVEGQEVEFEDYLQRIHPNENMH